MNAAEDKRMRRKERSNSSRPETFVVESASPAPFCQAIYVCLRYYYQTSFDIGGAVLFLTYPRIEYLSVTQSSKNHFNALFL